MKNYILKTLIILLVILSILPFYTCGEEIKNGKPLSWEEHFGSPKVKEFYMQNLWRFHADFLGFPTEIDYLISASLVYSLAVQQNDSEIKAYCLSRIRGYCSQYRKKEIYTGYTLLEELKKVKNNSDFVDKRKINMAIEEIQAIDRAFLNKEI